MKKILPILLCASLVFAIGVAVSYRNTSYLGYDNTRMFYADNEKIIIMDNEINYKELKNKAEKILKNTSDLSMPI